MEQWGQRVDRLVATMKERSYKPGWFVFRLGELKPPLEIWRKAGKLLGFKPGWAFHKHREFTLGIKPEQEKIA